MHLTWNDSVEGELLTVLFKQPHLTGPEYAKLHLYNSVIGLGNIKLSAVIERKILESLAFLLSWRLENIMFICAPSSEFVSSSIPSWQVLTAHALPFRGARDLAFCLKVPLDSLLVWARSEGSGETARMRRLAWTFAARICDKYQIRLTRSIYSGLKPLETLYSHEFCLPEEYPFWYWHNFQIIHKLICIVYIVVKNYSTCSLLQSFNLK